MENYRVQTPQNLVLTTVLQKIRKISEHTPEFLLGKVFVKIVLRKTLLKFINTYLCSLGRLAITH